ncbi:MAG: MmgE/PrpD family protein [Deltaproteobacteria bacterium]|nr:MmgE/PrpD family protein [Deltaproteobacteria bacterium]
MSHRVKLVWDRECEEAFPAEFLAKVTIKTGDGSSYSAKKYPKGSAQNPIIRDEVKDKFRRLATPVLSTERVKHILDIIEGLERLDDVGELSKLLICE